MSGNPDDVAWLDLGPDPDEGKPGDPRRRYLWYGGAAALVVAVLLTRTQHSTNQAASAPRSPEATVSPSSASASASAAASASSGSFANPTESPAALPNGLPVQVRHAGHRLLDAPADWELFARGEDSVIRIQLALGRATITAVPRSAPDVSVAFVVGADRAIVRPMGDIPGSVVRDGKPAADLPQSLRQGYTLLPGPDARHLWAEQGAGLSLVTLDGKSAGATIDIPFLGSVVGPDGTGYALLSGLTGGAYYATPRGIHRITNGMLLAIGPTRWLTVECGDDLSCALVVTDRTTGAHHTVETATGTYEQNLILSPDGRTVAAPRWDGTGTGGVELLDLDSGVRRPVDVTLIGVEQSGSGPSFVWSPDSRWLFVVNADRQVVVVNRATGKATPLGMDLPPVLQLAWRPRTG